MPTEAPFLFSIAGVSASVAGLAGLVAALRRGSTLAAIDVYRLRQIVEFAFANVILALSTVVLLSGLDRNLAVALAAGAALVYFAVDTVVLVARLRRARIPITRPWLIAVSVIDLAVIILATEAVISRSVLALEGLLIAQLLRPMVAFLFVLESFDGTDRDGVR